MNLSKCVPLGNREGWTCMRCCLNAMQCNGDMMMIAGPVLDYDGDGDVTMMAMAP